MALFLFIPPTGARLWRFKYRLNGKEKLLALGAYPDVSLRRAREKRDDARRLVADGIDPSAKKQAEKQAGAESFQAIATEWLDLPKKAFKPKTMEKAQWTFNDLLFPHIGSRPIRAITAPELLSVFRRLEARGKHETAHRTKQRASQIFRFAIATGRAQRDAYNRAQRLPERWKMMQAWADYLVRIGGARIANIAAGSRQQAGGGLSHRALTYNVLRYAIPPGSRASVAPTLKPFSRPANRSDSARS